MFSAGQDTTASALAWHVKFLPQDPEIQRRLHDEVCAIFGQDGELNFEAIDDSERVPVLEAVVAETLRCAKVGSLTGREREWYFEANTSAMGAKAELVMRSAR